MSFQPLYRTQINNFNTLYHFMTNCKIIQLNNYNSLFDYQLLYHNVIQDITS